MRKSLWFVLAFSFVLLVNMTVITGAIDVKVEDITKNTATVRWDSDRDDVDAYTLSLNGSTPISIEKGADVFVSGSSGSKHTVEIIGTSNLLGKVYQLVLSQGLSGVYHEMILNNGQWVNTGQTISITEMKSQLVLYPEAGKGFYREPVTETVILEKVTIDIHLLNIITVEANSNNNLLGDVEPGIVEVLVGNSVTFTARPKEGSAFLRWAEVNQSGGEILTISYTEQVTLIPNHDMFLMAFFEKKPSESHSPVVLSPTPTPNNPNGPNQENEPDSSEDDDELEKIEDQEVPESIPNTQRPNDSNDPNDPNGTSDPNDPNDPGGSHGPNDPSDPKDPDGEDALEDIEDPEDLDEIPDDSVPQGGKLMPTTGGIFFGFFVLLSATLVTLGILIKTKKIKRIEK